ncbi:hypothetical protein ISS05_03315 [Candidatus Woesearchaeota archaeon]|nr:hypothetical protein [Candidatus Woesearchaeota archaeon]
MKFNKTGQVLMYGLIFGLFGSLITYLAISYTSGREFSQIGQEALYLIKASNKAEQALFYIDQSAKYSVQQTIYDLAQKGGFESPKCGDYFGYSLWNTKTKKIDECSPDYKENFKSAFSGNLDEYLPNHPEVYIPLNNYNLQLKNQLEIIGYAISDLEIPIGELGAEIEQFEISEKDGLQ